MYGVSMNTGISHFCLQCLQFWQEAPWIFGHGGQVKFLRCRHHPGGGLAKLQSLQPQDRSTWSSFDSPEDKLASISIQLDFCKDNKNTHSGIRHKISYKLVQTLTFRSV